MGELIPFDEAAARVRERRSRPGPSDFLLMSVIAFWPVGLMLFAVQGVFEALLPGRGRR